MKVEIQPELARRKPLAQLAEAASPVLEEEIGAPAARVTALWDFQADDRGRPIIRLKLVDPWGQASAGFSPDELQAPALRELRRVTRPDGRILLLDYRQSPKAGLRLLRQCLAPWMRWAFAGSFAATTERYLAAAGLATIHRRTFMGDGVSLLVLEPTTRAEATHSAA